MGTARKNQILLMANMMSGLPAIDITRYITPEIFMDVILPAITETMLEAIDLKDRTIVAWEEELGSLRGMSARFNTMVEELGLVGDHLTKADFLTACRRIQNIKAVLDPTDIQDYFPPPSAASLGLPGRPTPETTSLRVCGNCGKPAKHNARSCPEPKKKKEGAKKSAARPKK